MPIGQTTISELIEVDWMVKAAIRPSLALLKDILTGYIYALVKEEGLKIFAVRRFTLLHRQNWLF